MEKLDPIKSKRVGRFVEEYVKDRNGAQAVIRAGYTQNARSASVTATRLLAEPNIMELVDAEMARVSQEARVEAADVLRDWLALATADPCKVVKVRRLNCRHCWGEGHAYQWTAQEYAQACDAALDAPTKSKAKPKLPDCSGGLGYNRAADPNPDCPECGGEGVVDVFCADLDTLTGPERKLIQSVKQTPGGGIEVKLRDQDAALSNLARYLGLLIEKRELTGKNGKPLLTASVPLELPTDASALAALYAQIVGSD